MNFSLKKIEQRQQKISSISSKKSYRRHELVKCLRGLFIISFLILFCTRLFFMANSVISGIHRLKKEDFLTTGKEGILYDSKGEVIQTIDASDSDTEYVLISKIPDSVKEAFIATEDKNFYEHHGVDARGVLEDIYARLMQRESLNGMRYTITQQLIDNLNAGASRKGTFASKIKQVIEEQYTAIALEDDLSKEQILEYYLNNITLGKDIVGVQSASKRYFGKEVSELGISEASVLAATAKDPTKLSPLEHSEENERMRMNVLKNMLDEQYITESEYGDALGDDVYLRIHNNVGMNKSFGKINSYYADTVLEQVVEDLKGRLGYSATEAYQTVYEGGLKIYTCEDGTMQKICDDVVNNDKYYAKPHKKKKKELVEAVEDSGKRSQVSMVLMEQATGEVRAIVGGRGEKSVNHGINRAIDLERQPGTVFDVLSVYTPALDTSGMTLGTVQDDTEYLYPDTNTLVDDIDKKEHEGLITMRDALIKSKAVPAVKTLNQISIQVGYSYLRRFGLTTLVEKKRESSISDSAKQTGNDLQLKLGLGQLTDGVTNLEMTSAYAAFGNQGKYQTPKFYTKVVDAYGNVLLENQPKGTQIMKKSTAWLLTDAMSGGFLQLDKKKKNKSEGIAVSGKSGRTADNTDVWYMGYTPYYTFGIWAGNDEQIPLNSTVYVTAMWKDIMERVHQYQNIKKASFEMQEDIVSCDICTKCGNLAVDGICSMAEGGSTVRKEFFESGTEPKKNCTCHAKYRFCKESGKLATENCPEKDCYDKVFLLKKEIVPTKDSALIMEKNQERNFCNIHPAASKETVAK